LLTTGAIRRAGQGGIFKPLIKKEKKTRHSIVSFAHDWLARFALRQAVE
jgi:hypothetical protein